MDVNVSFLHFMIDSAKHLTKHKTQFSCTCWRAIFKQLYPLCWHKRNHNEILVLSNAWSFYNVIYHSESLIHYLGAIQMLDYFGSCSFPFLHLLCKSLDAPRGSNMSHIPVLIHKKFILTSGYLGYKANEEDFATFQITTTISNSHIQYQKL